jgi:hypothetical protein
MLLSLEAWAERNIEDPPSHATLRAWARSGRIQGAQRCGRRGAWRAPEQARLLHAPRAKVDDTVIENILNST